MRQLFACSLSLAFFASHALAQSVSSSSAAPTTDIIASISGGSTESTIFSEAANSNHARGQLFSLPNGSGSAYQIDAITVKKSGTQAFSNDTLTLRIFRGSQAQWDSGTGHTTSIDGDDYYVGTTATPLRSETFTLNASISDNHYVTFTLATPLVVSEGSDFGFFMTYEQGGSTQDRFRYREGNSGGRMSITTSSHSTSARNFVYFVKGSPITPTGTVTASSSAPSTGVIASSATGSTDTSLYDEDADANHARGQLFALADGSGTAYEISSITVKKSSTQSFSNDLLTLRLFEGSEADWDSGSGHSTATDGDDYYVDTAVDPVHSETFTLNGSYSDGDYITFQLSSPVTVKENTDFGFLMTYEQVGGSQNRFRHYEDTSGGGRISVTTSSHAISSSRRVVHYVQGTPAGDVNPTLVLASPFQDRMVLQRGKAVKVWGTADPNASVSASINGSTVDGTADATGNWQLSLPSQTAGGPYSLVVTSGSTTRTINDVLIGDVWFCFGQSNMVYTLNQMNSWADAYTTAIAANDNIRCLKIDQDGSLTEEESAGMNWLANSSAGTWTAVGSIFAHDLHAATNVPVAIIWAAWGSSSIEGWLPQELTGELPHFDDMMQLYQSISEYRSGDTVADRAENLGYSSNVDAISGIIANGWSSGNNDADIFMRTRPNILYNKMVHPVRNYGISGFIWYQGEANTGAPDYSLYSFALPKLVREYRERFGQGDIPFLGVQLPSYNGTYWPWFRESQDQLLTLNNSYVAVNIDTGISGNIHPTDTSKEKTGGRLALLARKYALGESIVAESPRFEAIAITGNQVTISFSHADGLTTDNGLAPAEFEIAGSDQVFHAATTSSISGSDVILSSTNVASPVAVRYAWSPAPVNDVNLYNGAGLPAAPFRTDSWPLPGIGAKTPLSVDDAYELAMNTTLNVAAGGVLENDIDLNHDPLTATLVSDVSHGTLALQADGSFSYTPHNGFAGTDSFTYQCSDGGLTSETATVTFTVTGVQTSYYSWRSNIAWEGSDDPTITGDPDHDGIENFLEFALGLDPLVANASGLPTLAPSGSDYLYDFNNVQEGVLYQVLISTDMTSWSDPAFAELTSSDSTPVAIPASMAAEGKMFVRLKVSEE